MKRVLHVIPSLARDGVTSFVYSYYKSVNKSVLQFDFLYSEELSSELYQSIKKSGGKCFLIPLKLKRLPQNLKTINTFFKKHAQEYSIIHVHQMGIGFIYLFFAWLYGIKIRIAHSHSSKFSDNWIKSIRNAIFIMPFKPFTTHIWGCSNKAGKFLFGAKRWQQHGQLIHNAIEINKFIFSRENRTELRNSFEIKDTAIVVLHVGQLYPPKNPLFLIDVFNEFHKLNPNAILISCGVNSMERELNQRIKLYHLKEKIKLFGPRNDVYKWLSAADIMIFPSLFEGFPISIIEAETASLPCLLADTITSEVAITANIKFLSLSLSPSIWALKANELLAECKRIDYSQEIREAGYDISAEAIKLEILYQNL